MTTWPRVASLEQLLYFLFPSQHPCLQTLYEMMKISERQSSAPTCALSCDDFWVDFSLQGSRCIGGCNQLSSSDSLCCLGAKCHCSCCWWDTHLCTRHLPLSAKGNLSWQSCLKCVELETVLGIIYIQLIEQGHLSVEVVCVHLYRVFIARPAWPLQDCSFLHCAYTGCFCPVCWTLMYFHKAPCQRSTWKDAKGFHKARER